MAPDETSDQNTKLGDVSSNRKNNLTVIRMLMAVAIIYRHSYMTLSGHSVRDAFSYLTNRQTDTLGVGVIYFFMMSGFLITAAWLHRRSTWEYLRRRALRLYPGVAVMSLFCLLVVGPLAVTDTSTYFHHLSLRGYLTSLARLQVPAIQAAFPGNPLAGKINDPMWSIVYQFRCYLIVAILGLAGALRYRALVLAIFLAAMSAFIWQTYFDPTWLANKGGHFTGMMGEWPPLLTFFTAGMVFYLYRDVIPYNRKLFLFSVLVVVASFYKGLAITEPIFGGYVLLYIGFARRLALHRFAGGADYSFGLYIYSWPIQQLLTQHFHNYLSPITLFLVSLAVTSVLAMGSYAFVEKRFIIRKPKAASALKPVPNLAAESAEIQPVS
ncbi:MAG TPA: acyltransferase [Armatimonadota bacterium]|jgi:peptidoglycan/LPS O-acetylase OafA/YrhL